MDKVLHNSISRGIIGTVVVLAVAIGIYVVVATDVLGPGHIGLGERFRYDLEKYRKVDPKLIIYDEVAGARIKVKVTDPRALCVGPEGAIYVVGREGLDIFSGGTGYAGSYGSIWADARCVAVDKDGAIYIGLKDQVRIIYSDDPKSLVYGRWEKLGPRAVLTSIAVTDQNVFVADAGNRVVLRYDKSGELLGRIGQKDAKRNVPGFVVPSPYFDLAVAADGVLRVVNPGMHRIEGYTVEGDFELKPWGKYGMDIDKFAGCCNPVNFAILPDGGFVTAEKGLTRVKIYDADGEFVGVVAGPEQFSRHDEICAGKSAGGKGCNSGGLDVAVDREGRILVLDPYTSEVRVFVRKKKNGDSNE